MQGSLETPKFECSTRRQRMIPPETYSEYDERGSFCRQRNAASNLDVLFSDVFDPSEGPLEVLKNDINDRFLFIRSE